LKAAFFVRHPEMLKRAPDAEMLRAYDVFVQAEFDAHRAEVGLILESLKPGAPVMVGGEDIPPMDDLVDDVGFY